ncbi:hypothetical protein [Cryptosporangium arvum]|uniref:hypothetical protein n=1 Tax=Cryptosporangium arvum TaxID=80871 RepID=UPI0004B4EA65|nr:hypothetical protein [Cryptosporangium arvum]
MSGFATLTWLNLRRLRGPAVLSALLVAAYAAVVTGPRPLASWYLAAGDFAQPSAVIPLLFGAGVAAPMLAREQQRRTIDLAYTQSMPRAVWLAARILPVPALAVVTALGARAAFRLPPGSDLIRHLWWPGGGAVRIGFLLFSVALGFCAGAVLGRTLPAMAVTVVGFLFVWYGGVVMPIVRVLVPEENSVIPGSSPRTVLAFAVVLYVFAAVLLAVTFAWMTRKVPRS